MRFDGKVGIVTGGASGIGRATEVGFAQRGGTVIIADHSERGAKAVAAEIVAAGGKAEPLKTDVTKEADIQAAVTLARKQFGKLDFIHNNAYAFGKGWEPALAGDFKDEFWDHAINIGLTAVFRGTRAALSVMREQGFGSIVNTASISGLFADYQNSAYNAAKAGVINFTRAVAQEYGQFGIRANSVCPGVIATPPVRQMTADPERQRRFEQKVPLRRMGKPEELANVVLFLASDLSSYVTGAAYVCDGGLTLSSRVEL
jgi:meso-butanediol dehydrogenase / (S,S)-butanediol dehydrogenase / diacetyl reductase